MDVGEEDDIKVEDTKYEIIKEDYQLLQKIKELMKEKNKKQNVNNEQNDVNNEQNDVNNEQNDVNKIIEPTILDEKDINKLNEEEKNIINKKKTNNKENNTFEINKNTQLSYINNLKKDNHINDEKIVKMENEIKNLNSKIEQLQQENTKLSEQKEALSNENKDLKNNEEEKVNKIQKYIEEELSFRLSKFNETYNTIKSLKYPETFEKWKGFIPQNEIKKLVEDNNEKYNSLKNECEQLCEMAKDVNDFFIDDIKAYKIEENNKKNKISQQSNVRIIPTNSKIYSNMTVFTRSTKGKNKYRYKYNPWKSVLLKKQASKNRYIFRNLNNRWVNNLYKENKYFWKG